MTRIMWTSMHPLRRPRVQGPPYLANLHVLLGGYNTVPVDVCGSKANLIPITQIFDT